MGDIPEDDPGLRTHSGDPGSEEHHLSESLSAWHDGEGELRDDQIERILADETLRARWKHYSLIRMCLRERRFPAAAPPAKEDRTRGPAGRKETVHLSSFPGIFSRFVARPSMQLAAVFAFAFVLAGAFWQFHRTDTTVSGISLTTLSPEGASRVKIPDEAGADGQPVTGAATGKAPVHMDLQRYLMHHSAYLAHIGVQGSVPHARLVSYTEER